MRSIKSIFKLSFFILKRKKSNATATDTENNYKYKVLLRSNLVHLSIVFLQGLSALVKITQAFLSLVGLNLANHAQVTGQEMNLDYIINKSGNLN